MRKLMSQTRQTEKGTTQPQNLNASTNILWCVYAVQQNLDSANNSILSRMKTTYGHEQCSKPINVKEETRYLNKEIADFLPENDGNIWSKGLVEVKNKDSKGVSTYHTSCSEKNSYDHQL